MKAAKAHVEKEYAWVSKGYDHCKDGMGSKSIIPRKYVWASQEL